MLGGTSELHLDIQLDILKRRYRLEPKVGAPHIAYRETLGRRVEIDYSHKKQTGSSGEFARVKMLFEPTERGSGYAFESVAGGDVPADYVGAVGQEIEAAKEEGLLYGVPVIDFRATLLDAAYHDIDSTALAFQTAARAAFWRLREQGASKLLEPIMKVEVTTPEDYVGDVIGDLNNRRGHILGARQQGEAQVITALVPLSTLFGWWRAILQITRGSAESQMEFDHYREAPPAPPDDTFPEAVAMRA
jgi:elongation factor G